VEVKDFIVPDLPFGPTAETPAGKRARGLFRNGA